VSRYAEAPIGLSGIPQGHIDVRAFLTHRDYDNRANWSKEVKLMRTTLASSPGFPSHEARKAAAIIFTLAGGALNVTIQIDKPELEALIVLRMQSGEYESTEDLIWDALRSAPAAKDGFSLQRSARTLEDVFTSVRGMADDLDVSRNSSAARPIDL